MHIKITIYQIFRQKKGEEIAGQHKILKNKNLPSKGSR